MRLQAGHVQLQARHVRLQAERHTLTEVLRITGREISITFETATTDAMRTVVAIAGPTLNNFSSLWLSATCFTITASLLGVANLCVSLKAIFCDASASLIKSSKAFESEFNDLGGSSSVPISIRRSRVAIVNDLSIPCVIR